MERINLNVPLEVRKRLKSAARRAGRSEAEAARRLLTEALDREEREEFHRRVAETMTPQIRARQLEILAAFERLGG